MFIIQNGIILVKNFILEVICVVLTDETKVEETTQEQELFIELDKGIEDMEAGRVTPHDEAMKKIRESVGLYAV